MMDPIGRLLKDLGVGGIKGEEATMLEKVQFTMKFHRSEGTVDPRPYFHTDVEDLEADSKHGMRLDLDIWAEMGHPDTITVTVERGDTLNG